jgi:hypothetical protein
MRVPSHGGGRLRSGGRKKAGKKAGGSLVRQKHGGAIHQGPPANPVAGPGRPPDAFRELCRELASAEKTIGSIRVILGNPKHPQFVAALKWASEHGYGKPKQDVAVTGDITLEMLLARSMQPITEEAK